jgi:hypothetical protein
LLFTLDTVLYLLPLEILVWMMIQKNLWLGTHGCSCLPQVMQPKLQKTEYKMWPFSTKHSLQVFNQSFSNCVIVSV